MNAWSILIFVGQIGAYMQKDLYVKIYMTHQKWTHPSLESWERVHVEPKNVGPKSGQETQSQPQSVSTSQLIAITKLMLICNCYGLLRYTLHIMLKSYRTRPELNLSYHIKCRTEPIWVLVGVQLHRSYLNFMKSLRADFQRRFLRCNFQQILFWRWALSP